MTFETRKITARARRRPVDWEGNHISLFNGQPVVVGGSGYLWDTRHKISRLNRPYIVWDFVSREYQVMIQI